MAPYAMMVLFGANAVFWWGWGPAVALGWATNSDFYLQRNLTGFSFILGLPIFTAVIMGEPVIRDFRSGVYPLIFSKPLGRTAYLLGKFSGNFLVLVCCQSVFALTLLVLQWVPFSGMVTLPVRVFPYFKHFFLIVVISHLALAAFYFTAGALTRNAKVVYALAACFYPAIIAYELALKSLSTQSRVLLDPLAVNFQLELDPWHRSAGYLNQYVVRYDLIQYANRVLMISVAAVCLLILYFRFSIAERSKRSEDLTVLTLAGTTGTVNYNCAPRGWATTVAKLVAAVGIEFRLLRAERSLVVLLPLAIFLATFELAFYRVVPEVSYSGAYASGTAKALLLFLVGMIIFYTGEAMHRDRELGIEPVVWATPAPNSVLLLSKCLATVLLSLSLTVVIGLTAIAIQLLRGHTPVDFFGYLLTYGVIVAPSIVFITAVVVALNVLLRNKYLAYVAAIGMSAGLFYLYSTGYKHWLYNPLVYQLWSYADLTNVGPNQTRILAYRLYCLAVSAICLALAHLFFQRKS
jgi:ABC-type transport system involved in multi-copper enzyme maturation permease subunit